ncbi:MAG TPA: sugar ABC transporter ATP-binding protein [Mycobacteriales bacterium]|jgi:ABC-type sugar transport system, ATPase component
MSVDTHVVSAEPSPALHAAGLSKHFGGTRALHAVDFVARESSVHALLGRNGSGKSTLIKIIAGYHQADSGSLAVHDNRLPSHHSPRQAHAAGLRFVHQDLGLAGDLSVAENLALDVPYRTGRTGTIQWRKQYAEASAELAKLNLDIDPRRPVNTLGPVGQTLVAVARALQGTGYHRSVLFLDEPTARLPRSEVEKLLDILGVLKSRGVSVVYVTHRLDEVFAAADEVTVLRDGERVFTGALRDTDEESIRRLIIGRVPTAEDVTERSPRPADTTPFVEARRLCGRRVQDVSFRVMPGEVVAVTGLIGSGRSELGRLLYGIERVTSGDVLIRGSRVARLSSRGCTRMGIGYVPQERGDGLAVSMPVADNLVVTSYEGFVRGLGISRRRIIRMARTVIDQLAVAPPDPTALASSLSGGNQQKVSLGKWTRRPISLLILDEPLQGIDVGAKADIMRAMRARAESEGLAVLWLESDVEEVAKYADRVLVMKDGRLQVTLERDEISRGSLLTAVYSGVAGKRVVR